MIVVNLDAREPIRLSRGDRIAQLVVQRVERAAFEVVDELPDSVRAEGGFGSTGGFRDHDVKSTGRLNRAVFRRRREEDFDEDLVEGSDDDSAHR